MRRILLSLAILANAATLRAGVYNLDPPRSIYPSDLVQATTRNPTSFLVHLGELRAIHDRAPNASQPEPGSLRAGYLRQEADLEARQRAGVLSAEESIDLGACLIRLGRLDSARAILEETERRIPADDPAHFLVLLNLASAYQEEPELLPRAIVTQTRALKAWPNVWAGWTAAESDWYRRVETYVLRLMHLRQAETRGAAGRSGSYQTVDVLFPDVRFVGPGGRYEAGAIDFDMRNSLPRDAESIVIQLQLWQPLDNRLYWLYGELLNARGAVDVAYRVLHELVDSRNMGMAELRAHRRVLLEAQEPFRKVQAFVQQPTDWEPLLWALAPRGQLLTPGIGSAANETAWAAALQLAEQPPAVPSAAPVPSPASNGLPDWRPIAVSFVTGVVVAVLGVLQWQQWRRSRRVDAPARATSDPEAPSAGEVAGPSRYSRPVDG